jgi:hypothetical protein
MLRCHLISFPPSSLYSLLLFSWTELRTLRTAEVGVGVGEADDRVGLAGGDVDAAEVDATRSG